MLRDTSTISEEEPGIKLASFRLPADPLYLLSHMPPPVHESFTSPYRTRVVIVLVVPVGAPSLPRFNSALIIAGKRLNSGS